MSKWVEARSVAIKEGNVAELDDNENIISAEYDSPYIYLIVIKDLGYDPGSNRKLGTD